MFTLTTMLFIIPDIRIRSMIKIIELLDELIAEITSEINTIFEYLIKNK